MEAFLPWLSPSMVKPRMLLVWLIMLALPALVCRTIMAPELGGPLSPIIKATTPTSTASPIPPTLSNPSPTPSPAPTLTPTPNPVLYQIPEVNPANVAHPDRPRLSGEVQLVDSLHFRIHYSLEGDDAVPSEDQDGNLIPDYVQDVILAFEKSWTIQFETLGWAIPPADEAIGGDDRYDVYLQDIFDDGTAGYTEGAYENTLIGDNPYTLVEELYASHSFIVIDNDFEETDEWAYGEITPLNLMRVTAAHELNHASQYGYDGYEPADWLWEATATWMEDHVFDGVNDGDSYLEAVFKSPDTCQIAEGGTDRVEDEGHWYGMWIFLRFISEQHGDDIIRAIWENAISVEGYTAIERALATVNQDLDEVLADFAIALLLRDFNEGSGYPTVRLEGEAYNRSVYNSVDGVAQMGVDYIEILLTDNAIIRLDGLEMGVLVALQNKQADIYRFSEKEVIINPNAYDNIYVIVLNTDQAVSERRCERTTFSLAIAPGEGLQEPDSALPAPLFLPPSIEPLLEFEDRD